MSQARRRSSRGPPPHLQELRVSTPQQRVEMMEFARQPPRSATTSTTGTSETQCRFCFQDGGWSQSQCQWHVLEHGDIVTVTDFLTESRYSCSNSRLRRFSICSRIGSSAGYRSSGAPHTFCPAGSVPWKGHRQTGPRQERHRIATPRLCFRHCQPSSSLSGSEPRTRGHGVRIVRGSFLLRAG